MSSISLELFEWHDLPVSELCITDDGVSLVVADYNDTMAVYETYVLRIIEPETIALDVTGVLSARDLWDIEVSDFTYSVTPAGHISGTLGLLPGRAGYWKISFTNARWELTQSGITQTP